MFLGLQETVEATVVFEFMKIKLSNQRERERLKLTTERNKGVE